MCHLLYSKVKVKKYDHLTWWGGHAKFGVTITQTNFLYLPQVFFLRGNVYTMLMSNSPITLADVARLAGVSKITVSKTLNNTGRISEGTRERVLKAVSDLGYVVNSAARSLRGGKTGVLGMVIPELVSPYFAEVARAAADEASQRGFDLGVFTTSRDVTKERARIGTLLGGLADGLLVVVPSGNEKFLLSLERSRAPIVLINHFGVQTHLPMVRADSYLGAKAAILHLLSLGHRRIGFVTGAVGSSQAAERLRSYREVLAAQGLLDENLIRQGNFTQRGGFEAARELLLLPELPTAIFAASDVTAFGVIDAIKDKGLRVPDDISVVGFDDIPAASQVHPALTTVRHPVQAMAQAAMQLILDAFADKPVRDTLIEFPSELVIRESTKAI